MPYSPISVFALGFAVGLGWFAAMLIFNVIRGVVVALCQAVTQRIEWNKAQSEFFSSLLRSVFYPGSIQIQ
jgi:hypothetical protein